jgi:hypothetical protein
MLRQSSDFCDQGEKLMTEQIKLFVDPEYVEQSILELRQLQGVQVRLEVKGLEHPQPKEHPQYDMSFTELAPIIISVSGMITSLVALATAIITLRAKIKTEDSNDSPPVIIVIGEQRINVLSSSTVVQLESEIRAAVEQTDTDSKT